VTFEAPLAIRPVGSEFVDELRAALPGMRLATLAEDTEPYRRDQTAHLVPGVPLGVAFPASTEEVSAILRLATRHRVPIVPRGAGTGLSGGAASVDGALTVVLTGMDRVLHIDPDDLYVVVQPGIINAELGRAVEAHGLSYPPDPASYETCSIGGNLAEDAGGLRCIKYGVTRDYVLGLEVVLADGAVIRTGGRTVKDAMGYDLTQLFIGSEGTLGIITEATLRLVPQPAAPVTALAFFRSPVDAGRAVAGITRARIVPATLELMDRTTIRAVDAALAVGLPADAGAVLLIESDAGVGAADAELDGALDACRAAGATRIDRAANPAEADALRDARRKAHWSLERMGIARMEDVGVPRSRSPELLAAIERIAAANRLTVGVFGHAGDGNFHPTFVTDPADPDGARRVDTARAEMYAAVLELGGTVSGEHGTGLVKREWLVRQRGEAHLRAMRAIKSALDPLGILNPGKVFLDRADRS
jgi:glycolate oxidase